MTTPETSPHSPRWTAFDTPRGFASLRWSDRGITGVNVPARTLNEAIADASARFSDASRDEPSPLAQEAIEALRVALAGDPIDLRHVPIDLQSSSDFDRRTLHAAREIPPGSTLTYRALAERVGSPGACRAVGQAMRRNPVPLLVPCHRVLASDGRLGGFSAGLGARTKLTLLLSERDGALRAAGSARLRFDPATAVEHLRAQDPDLGALIDRLGPCTLRAEPAPSAFDALARAVVFQQLTARAAETIHLRVCAAFPHGHLGLDPARVARAPLATLRAAGLSEAKCDTLRALARASREGTLPTFEEANALSDEDVIARLTSVRGIGRWTAEMFLLFTLGRPDVFPLGDYGVRKGFSRWTGHDAPAVLAARSARWAPHRSVATWYLWRANDAE
jgi:methylated-DNA-[protein]-cysteine S-methyltransferase